jgi:hypothetical protein
MYVNFELFNEAIKLSDTKKYTKIWTDSNMINYLSDWFDNKYRIYLPLDLDVNKIKYNTLINKNVIQTLSDKGYEIESYVGNLCKKIDTDKNFTKITKILQKNNPNLLVDYQNELIKIGTFTDYMVVISRHPVDIAGMTTGRNWKSCMDIKKGEFKKYVAVDVKSGTIIAYLIKNDDKNIQNPISRILIKPYVQSEDKNKSWLIPERIFGTPNQYFINTVEGWLETMQGVKPYGVYDLKKDLYADVQSSLNVQSSEIMSFVEDNNIDEYTVNKDGSVNVNQGLVYDFNISGALPIKIQYVKQEFKCYNCDDFINFPETVNSLSLRNIKAKTLDGVTKNIFNSFEIQTSSKTSLKGLPTKNLTNLTIDGNFTDLHYLYDINSINRIMCIEMTFEDLSMLPQSCSEMSFVDCKIKSTRGIKNTRDLVLLNFYNCDITEYVDVPEIGGERPK